MAFSSLKTTKKFCSDVFICFVGLVTFLIVEASAIILIKLLIFDCDYTRSVSIYMAIVFSASFVALFYEDMKDWIRDQFSLGTEKDEAIIAGPITFSKESVGAAKPLLPATAANADLRPNVEGSTGCCPLMDQLSCCFSRLSVREENDDDDSQTHSSWMKDSAVIINDEVNPIDVPLPPDSDFDDDDDNCSDLSSQSVAAPPVKVHQKLNKPSRCSMLLKTNKKTQKPAFQLSSNCVNKKLWNKSRNIPAADFCFNIPKEYIKFKLDFATINKQLENDISHGKLFLDIDSSTFKV